MKFKKSVDLEFDIHEEYALVTNTMAIVKKDENAKNISLDSIDLELEELWLNDLQLKDTRFVYRDEKLTILNVPSEFSLKIVNMIYENLVKS